VPTLEDGTVSLGSSFYIEREVEQVIREHLRARGETVTVKGHQQVGKSSLLARLHARAIDNGIASCVVSFLGLDATALTNSRVLFLEIAKFVSERLRLADPISEWIKQRSPKRNLTWFMENKVLTRIDSPVQLLFDETDLIFPHDAACNALFSTLRYWHNERANDLDNRGWKRLGLVIAHSTDPALWVRDLNQSPFNVGLRIVLDDFDDLQVAELNKRYSAPLRTAEEIDRLMRLVGGHPYLVRLALYTMATQGWSLTDLERVAVHEDGPFAPHLRRLLKLLVGDKPLKATFRRILESGSCEDELFFQKLWAVGLIRGETRYHVSLRYKIYEDYFRKRLWDHP
jgi:hypothetical protein